MKKPLCVVLCALLACAAAFAQKSPKKPPFKFGDIPMEDMKMTVYPKDSTAEAVVLGDYGTSTFQFNGKQNGGIYIEFERTLRIKILTKEGLRFSEFAIPLVHIGDGEERIDQLKVSTYNLENGKIVETRVDDNSVFKEELTKNIRVRKIAWTNVKEGSVIEIYYRTTSDFGLKNWTFQSEIPTRWSEYRATIPQPLVYKKVMQGYVTLAVSESSSMMWNTSTFGEATADLLRWAAQDVPAFKPEPFINTEEDYISKLKFELAATSFRGNVTQLSETWQDINNTYWKAIREKINGSDATLKDDVDKAIAGSTTDEQKVSKLFDYVRNTVLWNDLASSFPGQSAKKVLETKKGSSADINILLASMIQKTGVPVSPVLLSTHDNGFVRENNPFRNQFNYVICAVKLGEKTVLLDATNRTLPFGIIPERCLNGQGFVVGPESYSWTSLNPIVKSRTSYTADFTLTPDGGIDGTLSIDKTGYQSAKSRTRYKSKGESDYVKELVDTLHLNVSKSEFKNVEDINQPFSEVHKVNGGEHATTTEGYIYLSPFIVGRRHENPFKLPEREYPVDFENTFEEFYIAKIAIPEGYVVEELPQNKVMALPANGGRYAYNFMQNGNVLNFTSMLSINRQLFTQLDYPQLREFYNIMVAKQAEQIVLKRK
ncbi:MAG: transglutaminase-like domain-containing protein [Bacteroidota bacterium]